ncbi:MAG: nicotinamide riboside transporter PnuC [Bacteroidota bacterium]
MELIQVAALVFGVAEVLLARANKVWLYPTGIISILLSMYSLVLAQLYADCLLHIYYLIMSIYGWFYWSSKKDEGGLRVTFSTRSQWLIAIEISVTGSVLFYFLLVNFTPSTTPVWDAWVSATGCAGMWLLTQRKVENWILLNISNAFAIPLLIYKELYILSGLTAFLFVVACVGYFEWRKLAQTTHAAR